VAVQEIQSCLPCHCAGQDLRRTGEKRREWQLHGANGGGNCDAKYFDVLTKHDMPTTEGWLPINLLANRTLAYYLKRVQSMKVIQ